MNNTMHARPHAGLRAVGLAALAALALSLVGLAADPRLITGAPAWLKPAKFAASIAIYSLTLAWLAGHARNSKVARWSGNAIAVLFVLEWFIIAAQAARGTTSHFNVATPLDAALFRTMGVGIVLVWMASLAIFVVLRRAGTPRGVMGHAGRVGLAVTLVGSALGGAMLGLTRAQRAELAAGGAVSAVGGHTVGAPDGGPGLPGTGWSTEAGDVRVAHFFGMHGMQALPLLAWLLAWRTRLSEEVRRRLISVGAASYTALVGILFWQALRGQSLVAPDAATLTTLGIWLAAGALAAHRALAPPAAGTGIIGRQRRPCLIVPGTQRPFGSRTEVTGSR